jgi:protein-tyrosine kinase
MGRTLDILKHRNSGAPSAKITTPAPSITPFPILPLSEQSEEIPFVEVGGPGHTLLRSSPAAMGSAAEPKKVAPKLKTEGQEPSKNESSVTDPPNAFDFNPMSVAFHPLGSLHSIETATGLVASDLAVYHEPDSPISREFQEAANGIHQQLATGGTHVLLFTGVSPRAGTTTTVLNLAMIWAKQEKRKVLVVDASEARAAVASKMGVSSIPGLADVLKGTIPWQQALQETKQPNCWILAAGAWAPDSNAPLQPKAMRDLLRQARKQFDLILLDALSWNEESATLTMASGADAVYLVLRQSESKTSKVNEIIARVQRHDIFLGGCVITHRKKD